LTARFSPSRNVAADLVLYGDKTLLRPFTESDIDATYIGWLNDPEVVRFSNQRFRSHDRETSLLYLQSFKCSDNLFMSVRRRSDEVRLGTLTTYISKPHGTADIGIMIGEKSVWGQGYGQDAWNTLIAWLLARDDIRKLTAGTLGCNFGMIKLMQRSGMQHEATRKAQEVLDDQPQDILLYAKFGNS